MLTFDEETHSYHLDGVKLPSVTGIIKPLYDFSSIPPLVLAKAAAYGTAVHKMIELEIKGELDYGTLDDGLLPALEAFGKWKSDYPDISKMLPSSAIEKIMASTKLRVAGTADIIIDGLMVIDIKTREPNLLTDSIQCEGYDALWRDNGGIRTKGPYEHRILCLKLDGNYDFPRVNHKDAKSRFRFLLDHYHNQQIINSWRNK